MTNEKNDILFDAKLDDDEMPAWKRLDLAVRMWAILSQHEQEQSDYQKMKEMYQ